MKDNYDLKIMFNVRSLALKGARGLIAELESDGNQLQRRDNVKRKFPVNGHLFVPKVSSRHYFVLNFICRLFSSRSNVALINSSFEALERRWVNRHS